MKPLSEIIKSDIYWLTNLQNELYRQLESFMTENNLSETQVAEKLQISKNKVRQILNGDSNLKMSELFHITLCVGKIPLVEFVKISEYKE